MRNEIVINRACDETIKATTNSHIWLQSAASPLQQKLHRMLQAAAYDVVDVCAKDKLLPFPLPCTSISTIRNGASFTSTIIFSAGVTRYVRPSASILSTLANSLTSRSLLIGLPQQTQVPSPQIFNPMSPEHRGCQRSTGGSPRCFAASSRAARRPILSLSATLQRSITV